MLSTVLSDCVTWNFCMQEFVQHQTEAKAGHKVSMDSKTTELSTSIKEMLSQTRKALEETKRVGLPNPDIHPQLIEALHELQELERTLIAERAKNECLIRLCVADESAEYIAEECRVATEQQLDAISFEQRSALADLKVAMDSEFSRSLRLARDRLRISRSLALEEQKIATLRHDLKFRTVADELTCLLNAQTKLEENRNQSIKQFHQRLMLELEDYIRKLKVILEIPDSFTVAVELQQCLDALNRNIRAASQSLARSLNLVHDNASNVMLQELRNVRTALLRAEELKEEEIGRRIEVLEEQKRQNIEEDEERRANFNSTVPVEDLEVETEISAAQDKLAVERIRLKFIEDERDALITQISEAKAEALCKGSETELPEVIDSLKKKSLARVEEMNEKVLQLSECQEADNLKSQEKRKDLIMQRICLAREARKKSTLWFERQAGEQVRINIIRAREAEWSTVLLDREAADNSFTLSTMGQSGLWARSYCTSVQDSIRKQTEELEDKQAAELAAFENKLKLSLSEKHQEIQSLRNKLDTLQQRICSMGDQEAEQETVDAVRREAEATQKEITTLEAAADLEAKAADVEKREFVEAQKQELFEHELKQQKEFMEAQWKLSRIAKFEELRSMQLDQSSNAVAQKEDYVKKAMAEKIAQVSAQEEEEIKALKERHYTELAEVVKSNEDAAKAPTTPVKGPRKSVMDFKLERLQTARQKEKQMKEQWKAKRGALEGWHPIFWCIVEEEAKQGSYEAYEASANVVARGPTLCNIERVINSLEEGSFLRNMIANLEILVKEFNVLGVPADSLASESEGSESDSSSSSSSSHQTDEPRQRTKASPASSSTSHSSDSSESSDESSDKSSSEGGSSEDSSSEDDSSGGTSSSKSSNTGGEARQDTQPASSTSGVRSGPDQAAPVQRILSSSSGDSMDSKDAQSPQPAMDKSSSASSEESGSSSSDGSEDAGSGTSTSRSSAIMSGTSSRSGSMSNDGTSDDSSAEAGSESSSSSSSSSGSNSSSHQNSNSSQSRNTSEDSGNSSSSQQSSTSGAESTSD
ncbi:Early endosome antigen 1, related [Eimeria maxima]|uniref:Early endosome antigen 1, related n=1 Tax=Eimeria maxima TaxID=5804 RepID=U6M3M6_EIMMA|nr:Early endosome antigen 1, related [Eimeria maxima]CDJ58837.1 Early endosome antigen 1, related [Eimeria maxima]